MISRVPIRSAAAAKDTTLDLSRVWRDTTDGIRFLREESIAAAMTGGIVVAFGAVGAVLAIGPVFVTQTLNAGSAGWGVVVTAFGVGMALGMATSNAASRVIERQSVFVWSLVAAAGSLFVLAAMPSLSFAAVVTVWLGAFCGLAWVSGYTLLAGERRRRVPRPDVRRADDALPRVPVPVAHDVPRARPGVRHDRPRSWRGVTSTWGDSGSTCPDRAWRCGWPASS